ncbi:phenylalanine--tRNA ligase subunit beta [uncultured Cloacibacillus sp.]|uniref:phenylalanine--tRNA ligase subunit beta n=1 Tax=uncultured Cloacibacillus sp. TaxID=889794 RepID=UPI0026DCBE00|nr:phenylalanine--tRNA ligase subunit beta [uncultured Cloacibacillus sp.]
MKLSLNWIKRYVDLPADLTMDKLAYDLTMCTVEVEDATNIGESLAGLVVGKILTVDKHPDADKLRVCTVDVGDPEPSVIVCGGINLAPQQLVAVAKPGAWVKWHGEGDPVEIKPAKLRGVMSYGMICASGEIGLADLFPTTQPAEIMDITEFAAAPGTPLADALDLNDVILEIDNKSMTNRPDLWGHYGMARELAAIYKCPLKPIEPVELPEMSEELKVEIQDDARCTRYTGYIIKGIKNVPSPFSLKSMLWRVGQRPINLPVDITNYIMFATGQPTHGFDRKHITGGIYVRRAYEGEQLVLLDGETLTLTSEDLVIADEKTPVGLAGVMGGKLDSILEDTNELILEIANFTPLGIRRTSQRFELRTDASSRYEKGIDPQRVDDAAAVALAAFKEYFPESQVTAHTDVYPRPLDCAVVEVSLDFLRKRLGRDLSASDVEEMLDRLGFKTEECGDVLRITAPSWRSTGDISLPDDILEEVARLMGYVNFPFIAPTVTLDHAINQRGPQLERAVREYLAFRCNMQEIFTYPWIDDVYIEASGVEASDMLELSTPPAPEERRLRSTLVPGLLGAVVTNLRYFSDFRIFELTQVFLDRNYHSVNSEDELLPEMARHLGAAFVGSDARALFREAKGVLEYMHRAVQMEPLGFVQNAKPSWADDKLWVNVTRGGEVIGSLGLVSPKCAKAAGIKRSLVMLFEIDVEKLVPLASRQNEFAHLPEYPLSDFDLSIVFDESVAWRDIEAIARKADLVKDVRFIDEYRGKQVGAGKKSVSFRIWVGSDKGTLTSEQIENVAKQVTKKINKKFGGDVRGAQ